MNARKIFVDCGSNLCKVLENRVSKRIDDEYFAFEPQPELADAADKVKEKYPDAKIHFQPKAVWTSDEPISFFLATKWGPNHRGGSTLMEGHTKNASAVDYNHPLEVQAVDFSKWLANTVTADDRVVVKMDIEGPNTPFWKKMITDGTIDLVDELIVEFHQNMNDTIEKEKHDGLVSELKKRTKLVNWR